MEGPVDRIAAAGGRFTGGTWTVDGLKVVTQAGDSAQINMGVDVAEGQTVPSTGAPPTPYPATKHLLRMKLVNDGQGWKFSVIEVLS